MYIKRFVFLAILLMFINCSQEQDQKLSQLIGDAPKIEGKLAHLDSLYVTAGNRLYMIGNQDGSFPHLERHIKGEISGIWSHSIKLLDGFNVHLNWGNETYELNNATSFINYPFANMHQFSIKEKAIKVERWQFVPNDTEGIAIQFEIFNEGDIQQSFDLIFTGHSDLRPFWSGERTSIINGQDESTYDKEISGWLIKDKNNPWFVCYSGSEKPKQKFKVNQNNTELTVSNTLNYPIKIKPGKSKVLTFAIAGSYTSKFEVIKTLNKLKKELPLLVKTKNTRYEKLAKQFKFTIPDKELEQTFEWLKYNCDWIMPIEMSIADSTKTIKAIGTPKKFANSFEVMALKENEYDSPNEALNYLERITRSFSYALPGSMYEGYSDFSMMTQGCNICNSAYSIVNQFFGIKSNAAKKEIIITPQIPDKWDKASLENVKIGNDEISIYYYKSAKSLTVRFIQTNWDWNVKIVLPKNSKNDGFVLRQGRKILEDKNKAIVSPKNGEVDATIYFE